MSEETLVCAATDAMRLVLGLPTRNFSREQIVNFLSSSAPSALASVVDAQADEIERLRDDLRAMEIGAQAWSTIAFKAEAKLDRLRGLQRFTVTTNTCITDNSAGEWIRADELYALLGGNGHD